MFDGRYRDEEGAHEGEEGAGTEDNAESEARTQQDVISLEQLTNVLAREMRAQLEASTIAQATPGGTRKNLALAVTEDVARILGRQLAEVILLAARDDGYFELPDPAQRPGAAPWGILCLECGAVSHNPNDIQQRYCARCHRFFETKRADSR